METIEISQRADLYAVAVHLFGDLLKDEGKAMVELAGGCLPILKGLVERVVQAGQLPSVGGDGRAGERVVHGLLSACLSNVDDMR